MSDGPLLPVLPVAREEGSITPLRVVDEQTSSPELSVVIPIFNEAETLEALVAELTHAMNAFGRPWEAVLVDDGSSDSTPDRLRQLEQKYGNLTTVTLRRNFGKAAALNAGFASAHGSTVVTMDSDLQDDPGEIAALVRKLEEGYDVVSGWKLRRRDPVSRRWLSKVFNALVRGATGLPLHDVNCGIKAYRRDALAGIRLYGELHRFVPVLAHFNGFRVTELPVNHRPRVSGRSRYGLERYFRGLLDLMTVSFFGRYGYRPLHLFGSLGLLSAATGSAICGYLTLLKLLGQAIGHRPLLVLGALLIVVGIQMLMMGLLAEMLTRFREERMGSANEIAHIRPARARPPT